MSSNDEKDESSLRLEESLMEVAEKRGVDSTFCPSDVARAFRPAESYELKGEEVWRNYLRPIRGVAVGLARAGKVEILRKGKVIDPSKPFRGVYRIRLKGK